MANFCAPMDVVRLHRERLPACGAAVTGRRQGAGDFSGGYVIHLAAGVSGFVAAAMVGPA